jgi:hypothetical protein
MERDLNVANSSSCIWRAWARDTNHKGLSLSLPPTNSRPPKANVKTTRRLSKHLGIHEECGQRKDTLVYLVIVGVRDKDVLAPRRTPS